MLLLTFEEVDAGRIPERLVGEIFQTIYSVHRAKELQEKYKIMK